MSSPLKFGFMLSATDLEQLPASRAEIAFIGRSNVGKSSLLNALAGRRGLAHVSKTPGRTRLLNLFSLGDDATAMDLPGYGFARVSGAVQSGWQEMIEGYLLGRDELVMVLVLVDGVVGPTDLDVQMLQWLRHHGLPFTVIASKSDRVKPSRRNHRRDELAEGCGLEPEEVHWVSAARGDGIEALRNRINRWLGTGRSKRRGRRAKEGFVPVQQNPDGTWPDEDEW